MANGLQPLLNVPGRVNASNALLVSGDTGASTGAVNSIGSLQGTATAAASDSKPALLVVFV